MSQRPREPHTGHRSVSGGLARATVFGVSDGLVSNVSLILGFAGAGVDNTVVRLAGLAGAVAGGISMAAGEWVSVTSQNDLIERELAVERREHVHNTEHETEELAAIYESHGMGKERAAAAAEEVMQRPENALAIHAREELGIDPHNLPSALWAAGLSLVSFLFGALLPVIPWYIGGGAGAAWASLSIGVVAAAGVGGLVGRFAERSVGASIARQVLIVLVACGVTYLIGELVGVNLGG
ncbi:MAG: VIT1/CCC1 transporter family protein [Ilumatobacter sp.]|uniref:VIT1/CCC1 transporter family protein n=1 Tax=Ilumatobacter sp. TaxID=1967498 RepID=UPI0026189675|nr:VIT1/CCC1 transporter family protein [Ilumatobacter sp.]MDJ0771376.1 VIT1/CCC1 transporter family protein [Ilumatobacter sp.]